MEGFLSGWWMWSITQFKIINSVFCLNGWFLQSPQEILHAEHLSPITVVLHIENMLLIPASPHWDTILILYSVQGQSFKTAKSLWLYKNREEHTHKNTWSIYHNYFTINESLSIWCLVTFSTVVGVQWRKEQLRFRSLYPTCARGVLLKTMYKTT